MTNRLKLDYDYITALVKPRSRVLDLGCGNGELLERLIKEKEATGLGVEIDEQNIVECIARGLSVFQGDIDKGLKDYPDNSYDYCILNQTLQVTHKPDFVLQEMLRVGRNAVVCFPNFAFWEVRLKLLLRGRMPKSGVLPFEWYNTPNIHLLCLYDFRDLCRLRGWQVRSEIHLGGLLKNMWPNLFAEQVIFVLTSEH